MKHTQKLIQSIKRQRRAFSALLAIVVLLPTLLASVVMAPPVQAQAGPRDEASSEDQQKAILNSIGKINEARQTFGMKEGTDDNDIDMRWHYQNDKFEPRATSSRLAKDRKGAPWLEWSDKNGDTSDQRIGGLPVRFVLSHVSKRDGGELSELGGKAEGVIYIFTNEYNASLKVILWSRQGTVTNSGDDLNRFVFTASCYNVSKENDKVVIAKDVGGPHGLDDRSKYLPSDPDGGDGGGANEQIKEYGLDDGGRCDVDEGPFAGATEKALNALKEVISAVLNFFGKALKSAVDVGTLTNNPGLVDAWKTFRDLVNLVFVLILIVIAFSNILRVDTEKYGVRALLPRLVFAVIAVNFSFLLVQIMVNVAYIISQPFLQTAIDLLADPPADDSLIEPGAGIGQAVLAILVVLGIIVAFAVLTFFFIIRILVIWLLAALSPFVFLFMILPLTRSLSSMWWKNAVRWIFMAPVAFMILFVAASLLSGGTSEKTNIDDPSLLLKVAFFVGAAFAAVMIPLKLGGEVMARAVGASKAGGKFGGKLGGKLGMAAADRIKVPGDSDATLGTRLRAGKAAFGARDQLKQNVADSYLQQQIAAGTGVGRIAGATEGQQATALEGAVNNAEKEMAQVTDGGHLRIAHAHKYGTGVGADGQLYAKDESGSVNADMGALQKGEEEFSNSRVHSAASFKRLAQSGIAEPDLVDSGPKSFANTGYQKLNSGDLVMSSIDRDGSYNKDLMKTRAQLMSSTDLKDIDRGMLKGADRAARGESTGEYDDLALETVQNIDASRLELGVEKGHRNAIDVQEKRTLLRSIANQGALRGDANQRVMASYDNSHGPGPTEGSDTSEPS